MDGTSWFISNVAIRQRVTNSKSRSSGMSGIVAAVISSAAVQSKEVAAEGCEGRGVNRTFWSRESGVRMRGKYEAGLYVFPKTGTNSWGHCNVQSPKSRLFIAAIRQKERALP